MTSWIRRLAAFATLAVMMGAAHAQTLTGAQAQNSPQAEAFLAYEQALLKGGLEAATPRMTPEKLAELQEMRKMFGEEGFKQFLGKISSGAKGEARRKQIEKVETKGDHAVLEARDSPNAVTVQHLARTKEGWKVTVRR
jgi:hypothetical protein